MAEDEVPEKKDGIERRVYNLPANLLARLRAYQTSQGIPSETEAARRLLDYALQMRDSVEDILNSVRKRYDEEKDLRVLASEILTRHALVTQIGFEDDAVWFRLKSDERGRFTSGGERWFIEAGGSDDYWRQLRDTPMAKKARDAGPSWEPPGNDLDEEIPF